MTGIVVEAGSGTPLPGAVVRLIRQNRVFETDETGNFELPQVSDSVVEILVTHVGYRDNRFTVNTNENNGREITVYLTPVAIELSPIVVSGTHHHTKFDQLSELTNNLTGQELQKELGQTLAATLKSETGLAIRSMGPAPARPVIRGLGGNRVFISEDGASTADLSATSPDHAVTIEPFSLERIEVVRGPRVLLNTSTTIGGVVNAVRHEIPREKQDRPYGIAGTYAESVNDGYLGSLITEIPFDPLQFRLELNGRKAGDLNTPIGKLSNSAANDVDYSVGGSYIVRDGYIGAAFREFNLDYGIPGGFIGGHPNGVDIEMYKNRLSLKGQKTFNRNFFTGLEGLFSRTYYRHKEFEDAGLIGSEFRLLNYQGYLHLNHRDWAFSDGGTWGLSFEYRDYEIGGYVFNPPATALQVAGFAYEHKQWRRFSLESAVRFELSKIVPEDKHQSNIGDIRDRDFKSLSVSLSALFDFGRGYNIGTNISRSSRIPTIEELFSEGPHLAAYSYEVGNPDLPLESGYGLEFFAYRKSQGCFAMVTLFYNRLNNYLIPRNTGEINFATFLPIYATESVKASLYGFESEITWQDLHWMKLIAGLSYTRGEITDDGLPLPQIPPLRLSLTAEFSYRNFRWGVEGQTAAKQDRIDRFEEATDGYAVFGGFVQYLHNSGSVTHNVSLRVDNIFDREYRNHLSRIKSIMPEAGRNFKLAYKVYFDL